MNQLRNELPGAIFGHGLAGQLGTRPVRFPARFKAKTSDQMIVHHPDSLYEWLVMQMK